MTIPTPSVVVNPSVVVEKPLITVNNDEENEARAQSDDIEVINLGYAGKPGTSMPVTSGLVEKSLTSGIKTEDKSEENEASDIISSVVVNPLSIVADEEKPLTHSPLLIDQSEENEVLGKGASTPIIPIVADKVLGKGASTPIIPIVADEKKPLIRSSLSIDKSEIDEVLGLPSKSVADSKGATSIPIVSLEHKGDAVVESVVGSDAESATVTESEEKEDNSKNIDRRRNMAYMKNLMAKGSTPADKENQTKFLKLIRLEQLQDVNAFDFTSFLGTPPIKGGQVGGQVGGANALYIDLDQETTLYSQKKKELENEIKKQQEDELALLSKQNEDLNKDESVQEVKWKYFITVELHLYPGDHIPLSAYASLACSKKSNDIYNIWQNIITKIKNPESKEKYKKRMLAYVPNKTVKNKETSASEQEPKNNTVKARSSSIPDSIPKANP